MTTAAPVLDHPHEALTNFDNDVRSLVAVVLSRFSTYSTTRNGVLLDNLSRLLSHYATVKTVRAPAPFPGFDSGVAPHRAAPAALRALGVSFQDVQAAWSRAVGRDGVEARLDEATLTAFLPPRLWPVLAAVIEEGADIASERFEAVLANLANDEVPPNRSRPEGGKRSGADLKRHALAARRLIDILKDLHHRGHPASGLLSKWASSGELKSPNGQSAVTDTVAPPRTLLRLTWQQVEARIADGLGVTYDEQLGVVRSASPAQLKQLGAWLLVRDRLLLAVCLVLALRVEAVTRLRRQDYLPRHLGPSGEGPALRTYPGKTRDPSFARIKPIPPGMAEVIEIALAYTEGLRGCATAPDEPLLPNSLTTFTPLTPGAIRQRLSGRSGSSKIRALLPKVSPHHGYAPHTLRAACAQMITSPEGEAWLTEHGMSARSAISAAEALMDHENMKLDDLGYFGVKKEPDREKYSGLGAAIAWEVLTTDRGARRDFDADAYRAAWMKRQALEGDIERVRREMRQIYAGVNPDETKAVLAALLKAQELDAQKEMASEALVEVRDELKEIRLNPARKLAIPDNVAEPRVGVDLDALERELSGGVPEHQRKRLAAVRDLITPAEFAFVLSGETGTGSTVRRWMTQGLPGRARQQYWDPVDPPIVEFSTKRRALDATRIHVMLLDKDQRDRLIAILATPPPEGWAGFDMTSPSRPDPQTK